MREIWKAVLGFEGLYEVSNLGRVKSLERIVKHSLGGSKKLPTRILKKRGNGHNYYNVALYKDNEKHEKGVHCLVLEAFVGKCPPGMQARHLDDDSANNKITNLRWGTRSENEADKFKNGLAATGNKNGSTKLTEKILFISADHQSQRERTS